MVRRGKQAVSIQTRHLMSKHAKMTLLAAVLKKRWSQLHFSGIKFIYHKRLTVTPSITRVKWRRRTRRQHECMREKLNTGK